MITVHDDDGDHEYPDATRYSNDEHNNLEVWAGAKGDRLIGLFNRTVWRRVEVDDDGED